MLKGERGIGWEPAAWEWPTPQRLHEDNHGVCAGCEPGDKVQMPPHPGRQPGEEVIAVDDERALGKPHGRKYEVPARERQLQLSGLGYRTVQFHGAHLLAGQLFRRRDSARAALDAAAVLPGVGDNSADAEYPR